MRKIIFINITLFYLLFIDNKRSFVPPKILQEFKDTDVTEGSALILKCRLDQGYPPARVLWYKEDSLIQPNEHYKLRKFI